MTELNLFKFVGVLSISMHHLFHISYCITRIVLLSHTLCCELKSHYLFKRGGFTLNSSM